jgi:glycosyltransferase involved in cell wall biosynthesis
MHTALLTWDFPPVPTGLGRAAAEIAYGLVCQGTRVTVFTLDRKGRRVSENGLLTVIGIELDDDGPLANLRRRALLGHLAVPIAFARAVREEERHKPFDVIEATNWYAPGALLADGPTPLVIRNSTPAIDAFDPQASLRDRADLRFAHWLEARTARTAAALISNAPHHAGKIRNWYGPNHPDHSVVPLSLEPSKVERGRNAPPPPANGPYRFVFVGRAERRKGFEEMLAAFARVALTEDVHLTAIGLGSGDLERSVKALSLDPKVLERITDLGRAEEEDLLGTLERSHAVLAPSRYESYGIVYREAAAFGRPLIACAEDPSASDLVAEHPIGILAERCQPDAIEAAIRKLMADAGAAARMREAGLALAGSLGRDRLGRKTLAVYDRVRRVHRRSLAA